MTQTSSKTEKSEWARYLVAVVVMLIAAVATGLLFIGLIALVGDSSYTLVCILAVCCALFPGFSGVFFGSLCFQPYKRLFGSLLLLVLGLGFYVLVVAPVSAIRGDRFPFLGLCVTGIGAAAAVAFRYWRQPPNTALEPTAAAPSVSDVPGNPKISDLSTPASGGGGSALDR
jgi:hypothetical protein